MIETKVRDSPIDSVVVYQDRADGQERLSVHLARSTGENGFLPRPDTINTRPYFST